MLAALSAPLLMLAQTAAEAAPRPKAGADCPAPDPKSSAIVICAERPQGYRINPDVMEARKQARNAGRPRSNSPAPRPDCATVGPAPCTNAGINLLAAIPLAVSMAKRVSEGKDVGSMFKTDPQPSEYQRYLIAKARREEKEADKAGAEAKRKAEAGSLPK
jgi:hypothetical protein